MKINEAKFRILKSSPNSAYEVIKPEFLFHSNRLEGSTFSYEELQALIDNGHIIGDHEVDDVYETMNSIDVFDYVIDTLSKPIDHEFVIELNRLLLRNTEYDRNGWTGSYKRIPNRIAGAKIEVALPKDVEPGMTELIAAWDNSPKGIYDIAHFHARFEHIHPFQDGNGRVGRFLILKQCIENDIDLISIDCEFEEPYKTWLSYAQTEGECGHLVDVFYDCQARLDDKMTKNHVDVLLDFEPDAVIGQNPTASNAIAGEDHIDLTDDDELDTEDGCEFE